MSPITAQAVWEAVLAPALEFRRCVGFAAFAPAAVLVLVGLEPITARRM